MFLNYSDKRYKKRNKLYMKQKIHVMIKKKIIKDIFIIYYIS